MTEVLTSANEAERRGKNGPVGRGLAGEPGDVSSAPGSAVASAGDLQQAAEPRPVPRVPRWRCSAFTCGSRAGNDAIINKGERSLGICPQATFSSPLASANVSRTNVLSVSLLVLCTITESGFL